MIPTLFNIGPFPVHTFGLMMVLAFIAGWRRISLSMAEVGEDPAIAERLVFWTAVGGVIGARIGFFIAYPNEFFADPLRAIISGSGFVFYGGFIGGVFAAWLLLRSLKKNFLQYLDLSTPALAIGYAVGRIGCQLSGDGDYGGASNLPWAIEYSLGVYPTAPGIRVHPAPMYESFIALIIAAVLLNWQKNTKFSRFGQLFGVYLILSASARFIVEFIRIEPNVLMFFTQAQLIAMILIVLGIKLLRS